MSNSPIAVLPSLGLIVTGIGLHFEAPDALVTADNPVSLAQLGERLRAAALHSIPRCSGRTELVDKTERVKTLREKVIDNINAGGEPGKVAPQQGIKNILNPLSMSIWVVSFPGPMAEKEGDIPGVLIRNASVYMECSFEGGAPNNMDFVNEIRVMAVKALPVLKGRIAKLSGEAMTPGCSSFLATFTSST